MRERPGQILCAIIGGDPAIGLALADAFDAAGYFVAGPFTTGKNAHVWLSRFTPDIAVVDQGLSDGTWRKILRELHGRKTLVLILASPGSNPCLTDMAASAHRLEK